MRCSVNNCSRPKLASVERHVGLGDARSFSAVAELPVGYYSCTSDSLATYGAADRLTYLGLSPD